MTPMEIALLLAIAVLVYQEFSWRDRVRRMEADNERRIATEVAMAYERSLAEGEGRIRALTFQAEKQEPRGLFGEVTRRLFITITMDGESVKYAAGDLNEIDRFEMPPEIGRAVRGFVAPEREMAGVGVRGIGL